MWYDKLGVKLAVGYLPLQIERDDFKLTLWIQIIFYADPGMSTDNCCLQNQKDILQSHNELSIYLCLVCHDIEIEL